MNDEMNYIYKKINFKREKNMYKIFNFKKLIVFCLFISTIQLASMSVRSATHADIPEALNLSWKVSIEYFEPFFRSCYSEMSLGQDPLYYLKIDAMRDAQSFSECVSSEGFNRLYIACDQNTQKIVGLIVFHQEENNAEIDLLLIDKEYRNKGIGKKLVFSAFQTFKSSALWQVYVFSRNEEALKFYRSLGFVDAGLGSKANQEMYPGISTGQVGVCLERK